MFVCTCTGIVQYNVTTVFFKNIKQFNYSKQIKYYMADNNHPKDPLREMLALIVDFGKIVFAILISSFGDLWFKS